MKKVYIMISSAKSLYGMAIKKYTHFPYAHVSLITDINSGKGYSFGRVKLENPLIGSFVEEDFLKICNFYGKINCIIYELEVTDIQFNKIIKKINLFIQNKKFYHYNYLGVLGYILGYPNTSNTRFYCAEFVAYILGETESLKFDKDYNLILAKDFYNNKHLKVVYKGDLNSFTAI